MTTKSLNGSVTLYQFVGILIPALVALGTALTYVVDAKVATHAAIPYHAGIKEVTYDKAKGEVLEQRLTRMEQDISEIKELLRTERVK